MTKAKKNPLRSIGRALKFLLTLWVLAAAAPRAQALPADAGGTDPAAGPYCGINCLYTALRAEGIGVDFASLLQIRYVGSASGSTVGELLAAAADQHAYGRVLTNLSTSDLKHLRAPAILHVKNDYDAPDYNHYILCVPADGQLRFYDPPAAPKRSPGHSVAPLWDGTAIVVSSRPIDLTALRWWAVVRVALWFSAGAMVVAGGRLVRRRLRHTARSWTAASQALLMMGTAVLAASGYHLTAPEGFAAQHQAVSAINQARFGSDVPEVDLGQARIMHEQGAVFVDAREEVDFIQGHIQGAVNLPPQSTAVRVEALLRGSTRGRRIVVYCAGPGCPYARHLARRLLGSGYENVQVLAGGWSQWRRASAPAQLAPAQVTPAQMTGVGDAGSEGNTAANSGTGENTGAGRNTAEQVNPSEINELGLEGGL